MAFCGGSVSETPTARGAPANIFVAIKHSFISCWIKVLHHFVVVIIAGWKGCRSLHCDVYRLVTMATCIERPSATDQNIVAAANRQWVQASASCSCQVRVRITKPRRKEPRRCETAAKAWKENRTEKKLWERIKIPLPGRWCYYASEKLTILSFWKN